MFSILRSMCFHIEHDANATVCHGLPRRGMTEKMGMDGQILTIGGILEK